MIDHAVDHGWFSPAELLDHVPPAWRAYIGEAGTLPGGAGARPLLLNSAWAPPVPADGGLAYGRSLWPAVPSVETLERDWLDPHGIDVAWLTHGAMRVAAAGVNPRLAEVLVRAQNDWTIARWLEVSDRVRGTLLVPEQVPEAAAAEIRRLGEHPGMAAVLIGGNAVGKPAGHPAWDPIYRAAVDVGLPVMFYAGADAVQDLATLPTAGGPPATAAELGALAGQSHMTQLVSLIGQATFERHPGLQVIFAGGGFSWLPSILWRFDTNHLSLRLESPWVRETPSETVRRHVRIAAFPFDGPTDAARWEQLTRACPDLRDLLLFASGHPSRRAVSPDAVRGLLPSAWSEAIVPVG